MISFLAVSYSRIPFGLLRFNDKAFASVRDIRLVEDPPKFYMCACVIYIHAHVPTYVCVSLAVLKPPGADGSEIVLSGRVVHTPRNGSSSI